MSITAGGWAKEEDSHREAATWPHALPVHPSAALPSPSFPPQTPDSAWPGEGGCRVPSSHPSQPTPKCMEAESMDPTFGSTGLRGPCPSLLQQHGPLKLSGQCVSLRLGGGHVPAEGPQHSPLSSLSISAQGLQAGEAPVRTTGAVGSNCTDRLFPLPSAGWKLPCRAITLSTRPSTPHGTTLPGQTALGSGRGVGGVRPAMGAVTGILGMFLGAPI